MNDTAAATRYNTAELQAFARTLFESAGLSKPRADIVSGILVEADLLGHDTHGLNLAHGYLNDLVNGRMKAGGDPEVISDRGAVAAWDGLYLPGLWLTSQAVDVAKERARQFGTGTVTIRRSHHIGCLAAYLEPTARDGMIVMILSSDPADKAVAPFGANEPIYTPNPIAVGYPTDGDPVLIDISASTTTMGLSGRHRAENARLPGPWLIDAKGQASDDPAVLAADPAGAIQPLGSQDRGHKGFALGLWVEAMTSALGGFGRAQAPTQWGASVMVQVWDPEAFGGHDAFVTETGWLGAACRAARVAEGSAAVRLPGAGGLARKRRALADGLALYPTIIPALTTWAERFNIDLPIAIEKEKLNA